jgi:hypothetical protein
MRGLAARKGASQCAHAPCEGAAERRRQARRQAELQAEAAALPRRKRAVCATSNAVSAPAMRQIRGASDAPDSSVTVRVRKVYRSPCATACERCSGRANESGACVVRPA